MTGSLRVITALVLLAILLPALFYSAPTPFFILALVLIAAVPVVSPLICAIFPSTDLAIEGESFDPINFQ